MSKQVTYAEAIRQALTEEFRKDENVVLFGEDVGYHGGAFGVTKGLWDEFGDKQIFYKQHISCYIVCEALIPYIPSYPKFQVPAFLRPYFIIPDTLGQKGFFKRWC